MKKRFSFLGTLSCAFIIASIVCTIYYTLSLLGLETRMNQVDRSLFVPWLQTALRPKNYFKFFYNLSIIILPPFSLILSKTLQWRIRNEVKFGFSVFFAFAMYVLIVYAPSYPISWQRLIAGNVVSVIAYLITFLSFRFLQTRNITKKICSARLTMPAFFRQKRWIHIVSFISKHNAIIATFLLLIMLYNFGYFLETGIWVNYYHHNFVIATINDLFQGKHLLVDTFNQYGLFFPFSLYLLFRFFLEFSYMNFYLLLMLVTMAYFAVVYIFLKKITGSTLLGLIGIYGIVGLNTLFSYPTFPYSEMYVWPGSTPLRYVWDIIVFLLLLGNPSFYSKKRTWGIYIATTIALFHNFESGISLLISILAAFFVYSFATQTSLVSRLKILLSHILGISISIGLCMLLFSLYTYLQSGHMPDWSLYTRFSLLYQSGLTSLPTPKFDWYLLYLLIYFSTVLTGLHVLILQKNIHWKLFVTATIAFYGLLLSNYYLGRSFYTNLSLNAVTVGIVALMIFSYLSTYLKRHFRIDIFFLWCIFFLFFLGIFTKTTYHLFQRLNYRTYTFNEVRKAKKYTNNKGFVMVSYNEDAGYTVDDLLASVAKIKELTPNMKEILLLSKYDTLLLVMAEKTHLIPYPMLEQIYWVKELEEVKTHLLARNPKPMYLFIDKKDPTREVKPLTVFDTSLEIFHTLSSYYEYQETVGILDVYRRKEEAQAT